MVARYLAYRNDDFAFSSGTVVSSWTDSSGNGNDLIQASVPNQFTLVEDVNSRQNYVTTTATQFMSGLPVQAGDYTYIIKYTDLDQANPGDILYGSGSGDISYIDTDTTQMTSDTGTPYQFSHTGETEERVMAFTFDGNTITGYEHAISDNPQSATGDTFTIESVGGKAMQIREIYVYDRVLVEEEIKWFSYLRNEQGDILLPPLLPSEAVPPTEIFSANVANFLGTGYTTTPNLNKSSLTAITEEAWVKVTGSNSLKGIISISGTESVNIGVNIGQGTNANSVNNQISARWHNGSSFNSGILGPVATVGQWYHVLFAHDGTTGELYVDGISQGSHTFGINFSNWLSTPIKVSDGNALQQVAGVRCYNQRLTTSQITALYNGGQQQCFDLVDPVVQAFCFYGVSLANYVGYTGQEKTDLSGNAIVTSDVGATLVYTGSAQIECEAQAPPVGIQWTQDFSLLDPVTDIVYGIDPAVTTWIDKGTSLTNLTQTTVANQADLVAGEMVFDTSGTYDFYEGVIAHPSDFSYYFEVSLVGTSGNSVFRSNSYDSFVNIRIDLDLLRFRSGALAINDVDLTGTTYSILNKFLIRRENDVFSVFLNGSNIGGFTDVGGEYLFETLSSDVSGLTGSFKNMSNINRALTDAEAIAETT